MSRNDVRKSKSKVRTYLKKCKDALYGHASDETCSITVNEDLPQSSNTSWYLAPEPNDSTVNKTGSDQLPKAIKTNQVDEQEAIDNEIKCMGMTESEPLVESRVNKVTEREFRNFFGGEIRDLCARLGEIIHFGTKSFMFAIMVYDIDIFHMLRIKQAHRERVIECESQS